MPICNTPAQTVGSKSATTADDHGSEAAKMKRTREQAYFNSYDFDAIEVLPYDDIGDEGDDDDDDAEGLAGNDGKQLAKTKPNGQRKAPLAIGVTATQRPRAHAHAPTHQASAKSAASVNSSATPSVNSSRSSSGRYSNGGSYLQRLGAFLMSAQHGNNGGSGGGNASGSAADLPQAAIAADDGERQSGGSFLLPRAILKYQSVEIANSMPLGPTTTAATAMAVLSAATTVSQHADQGDRHVPATNNAITTTNNNKNTSNSSNKTSKQMMAMLVASSSGNSRLSCPNGADATAGFREVLPDKVTVLPQTQTTAALSAPSPPVVTERNKKMSTSSTNSATTISDADPRLSMTKTNTTTIPTTTATATTPQTATSTTTLMAEVGHAISNNKILVKSPIASNSAANVNISMSMNINEARPGARGRTSSHQSHYSTDKSGSSGYYSSNVCSTYSLDDHIYCEPVIDILDVNSKTHKSHKTSKTSKTTSNSKSVAGGKAAGPLASSHTRRLHQLPLHMALGGPATSCKRDMNGVGQSKLLNSAGSAGAAGDSDGGGGSAGGADGDGDDDDDVDDNVPIGMRISSGVEGPAAKTAPLNEHLRILESSIENLDRHLKSFPSLNAQEHIAAFAQTQHTAYLPPGADFGEKQRAYHHLPTIMEGFDPTQPRTAWRPADVTDDSLLDIDLDSFLLVNERQQMHGKHQKKTSAAGAGSASRPPAPALARASAVGIDNPSFLSDEQEENHYKCAKYINSCPEDAYRVESDIAAGTGGNGSSVKSNSMEHYLKRYEDQLHFQNTRELLEDVRDKIRLLSHSNSELRSSNSDEDSMALETMDGDADMPQELQGMIKTLKRELESYLERMNQHSELEIRQLYSGLVKNQNVVKMKKAFERRRSFASAHGLDSECDFSTYEAVRDGVLVTAAGVPVGIHQQITSIRCASDPNFKMKRKSLTEVFPAADCYIEAIDGNPLDTSCAPDLSAHLASTTQMQRNLSFHKPILNKLNSKVGPHGGCNDIRGGASNGGSGSGSAGESGDKDLISEWHSKKPSIWEMYYGTNRLNQSLLGKRNGIVLNSNANTNQATMSYPSSRPESDFTLDLPRAEQLRIKMEKEKKFRQRCRFITTFLSLVFFLLTVMVVSLVLTRGKRMFGSMI